MYSYNSHLEKKTTRTISCVSGFLFILFSFVYLAVCFRYLLYITEDLSLFTYDTPFFLEKISKPGGILLYVASFFTQFLCYPWIGALIIIAFLQLIQWLIHRSFEFNRKYFIISYIPSFLLLVIITDAERSLYLMTHLESIFTDVLGISFLLLSYYSFIKIQDSRKSLITLCWLIPLLFFGLSGSAAIFFFGLILLCGTLSKRNSNVFSICLLSLGLIVLSFLLAKYLLYPHFTINQVLFGIHPITPLDNKTEQLLPHLLLLLFFVLIAIRQMFPPMGNRITSYARWIYTNIIGFLILSVFTAMLANCNDDFRYEMVIDRSIQNRNYNKALRVGKDAPHPTREMTVLRNTALVLSGHAGDKMFEYTQNYKSDGLFFDYNKDKPSYPGGAMIYFYLGAKHLATEWANNDYLKNRNSFRMLKDYVLIATANGHLNATKQTAQILDKTLFHRDFAKELYEIIADTTILMNKDQVFGGIKQRLSDNYYPFPTKGNYDKFICKFYRDNQDNKVAYEYYLMSALLDKNVEKINWGLERYWNYYKKPMSKHYAEAAALCNYLNKAPVMYVNKITLEKFKEFLKLKKVQYNPATKANVMRRKFGDTYWWYYFYK
jgi:hypothetical protein